MMNQTNCESSYSHGFDVNHHRRHDSSEDNSDSKEYEVKECVTEHNSAQTPFKLNLDNTTTKEQNPTLKNIRTCSKGKVPAGKFTERPVNYSSKNSPRSVRSNGMTTTSKPFTLATEKRASAGLFPVSKVPLSYESKLPSLKDSRFRKIIESLIVKKPLESEQNKQQMQQDSHLVASSTAASSSGTPKKKFSLTAPKFQTTERAEKRKEFNSKMEEKQLGLEAERIQFEARAKEETEVAIKELRKSLTIKATPLPSFYVNGHPPDTELRKLPTTHPKSPKLSRKKCCSDAPISLEEKKHQARLGNQKAKTSDLYDCCKRLADRCY